jgi:hypothetical protein
MATSNPLHPDTASQFVAENYNQNTWGVQNAELQTMQRRVTRGRAANTASRPRAWVQTPEEVVSYEPPPEAANTNTTPTPVPAPRGGKATVQDTIVITMGRVRATSIATTIAVWALPWYFVVQLPLGLLATLFITLAYGAQLLGGTSFITNLALESFAGFTFDAFLFLYFALSGLLCVLYVCQIVIATVQFKIGLIHPWFGDGVAFKLGSILLILLSSFVPILNMFPMLGLWIMAVIVNPK